MPKFGFIILHYVTIDMSIQCIDQLLDNFGDKNIIIVIVDNASPNHSGKQLQQKYITNQKIKVILHQKNDGFARGNNIGFKYLKEHFQIDFMIVMNNDIIINQKDFLDKIEKIYNEHHFAVLGPDIYAPKLQRHQNPMQYKLDNISVIKKAIKVNKQLLLKNSFNYYKLHFFHYFVFWWAKPIIKYLFPKYYKKYKNNNNEKTNKNPLPIKPLEKRTIKDCVLFGACYIFSKDFINKREYAFYPKTFFYYEENILCLQCQNEKLKTMYQPDIIVNHFCSYSTDIQYNHREKYRFVWKQHIKSMTEYLQLYQKYNSQL